MGYMISSELTRVRMHEKSRSALVDDTERSVFHFSPLVGWLNDPNGLSYFGGKHHMFYQYHPYSTYWGPMHWGHAVSNDLIKWDYLPCAMAPDEDYDRNGCFSGTALSLEDGSHVLMYTSCSDSKYDPTGKGRWLQTQSIALLTADGEYIKYSGNPVITENDLPSGGDPFEFRDPYLWRAKDGSYRVLVANGIAENISGVTGTASEQKGTKLLLYRSDNGLDWIFDKVLFEDNCRVGIMWECPNFFCLGDKYILMASPMDMIREEQDAHGSIRFPQGNNVCYITGSFDEEAEEFTPDAGDSGAFDYDPVDYGLDFYAPQVMKTGDGRQVMIGWMQNPKTADIASNGRRRSGIFGQMTVPRELSLEAGKLIQHPVRELEKYRKDKKTWKSMGLLPEWAQIPDISGRVLDIEMCFHTQPSCRGAGIRFAADDRYFTQLWYDPKRSVLSIDRSRSGQDRIIPAKRSIHVSERNGELKLRILLDRWSAEVFINGGEQVMSVTFYTDAKAERILFRSDGEAAMDITCCSIMK